MSEPSLKPEIHEDDQKTKPGVHFKFDFSINLPPIALVVAALAVAAGIFYLWVG